MIRPTCWENSSTLTETSTKGVGWMIELMEWETTFMKEVPNTKDNGRTINKMVLVFSIVILGMETWPDGSFYHGEYSQGRKNGFGKFKWGDGSEYEGEFYENNIHGKGKLKSYLRII
jgi:MORN repeat